MQVFRAVGISKGVRENEPAASITEVSLEAIAQYTGDAIGLQVGITDVDDFYPPLVGGVQGYQLSEDAVELAVMRDGIFLVVDKRIMVRCRDMPFYRIRLRISHEGK